MDNPYSGDMEIHSSANNNATIEGSYYRTHLKRVLDLALIIIALPILIPLMIVVSFIVLLDGASPFYHQVRIGSNGRHFRMWKFRSMVTNADEVLLSLLSSSAAARQEWDIHQKLSDDPRITKVGRLLRRSSLDELPQIWNILVGDMSLVGPRPMLPAQTVLYPGVDYFRVRPGLTGPWQVSGRSQTNFAARAEFDRSYVECLSFLSDLALIVKTVGVVLRATGR